MISLWNIAANAKTKNKSIQIQTLIWQATSYCNGIPTQDLVDILDHHGHFPNFVAEHALSDGKMQHTAGYDQAMIGIALHERADFKAYNATEKLDAQIETALNETNGALNRYEDRCAYGQAPSFYLVGTTEREAFDRMILSAAEPAMYGAKAAPRAYLSGLKKMATFWGTILEQGSSAAAEILLNRWNAAGGQQSDFAIEYFQNAIARQDMEKHPPEKVLHFKQELVRYMLQTGSTVASMDYKPSSALLQAGAVADIPMNGLSFPTDITTAYSDGTSPFDMIPTPHVLIRNGRYAVPTAVPVTLPAKLQPAEANRMKLTNHGRAIMRVQP